jgi:hypothetical protein
MNKGHSVYDELIVDDESSLSEQLIPVNEVAKANDDGNSAPYPSINSSSSEHNSPVNYNCSETPLFSDSDVLLSQEKRSELIIDEASSIHDEHTQIGWLKHQVYAKVYQLQHILRPTRYITNSTSSTKQELILPDMWSWRYIGLYSQYAAIGLLYGSSGALTSLCVYVYDGSPNLCANARNISFFAWSFKLLFAVLTDCYRPFGTRRKAWMIMGWVVVLLLLLLLSIVADQLEAPSWLCVLLLIQFFVMFADVPADGYSVELGGIEPPDKKGKILATGQMTRFSFCVLSGFIQAVFLNGPDTNDEGCRIAFNGCWSFGLSINQYYGLLAALIFLLCIPVVWLEELDGRHVPRRSLQEFSNELWETLQNKATLYLIIFVAGAHSLTNFKSVVNTYIQYYIIPLTNFQAGLDTMTTYAALASAIWVFKRYLLNKNWRTSQVLSTVGASMLGLVWILVFYDVAGLMNGWFTILIDLDQVRCLR